MLELELLFTILLDPRSGTLWILRIVMFVFRIRPLAFLLSLEVTAFEVVLSSLLLGVQILVHLPIHHEKIHTVSVIFAFPLLRAKAELSHMHEKLEVKRALSSFP